VARVRNEPSTRSILYLDSPLLTSADRWSVPPNVPQRSVRLWSVALPMGFRTPVRYPTRVGTWHDLDVGRPIAAPLERCAELLGVDLATVRELAAQVEPYLRVDGTRIWSLMQLERQLWPEAYGRRRGGYLDRRRTRR
jgi:hypothetical protein